MIESLKVLLSIDRTDDSKDIIIEHYISKSISSIQNHLGYRDTEWRQAELTFKHQIIDLAMFYYKNRNDIGKVQSTQGQRSVTIEKGIPKHIKDSLPLPRVRIVGGR